MPVDYAGNSLDKARQLDINSNAQSFRDRVDNLDLNDFYSFNLSSRSSFDLKLDGLKADADVALIRDANNNGQFDQGEVLSTSTRSGKQAESINEILGAGTYYIRVYPDGNAKTNYKLTVSATPFNDAISTIISTSADLAINTTSVKAEVMLTVRSHPHLLLTTQTLSLEHSEQIPLIINLATPRQLSMPMATLTTVVEGETCSIYRRLLLLQSQPT
jgi:hypothetical protein